MFEAMFIIRSLSFMEVIHIQLSDKGREVVVFEEPWENGLRELVLLLDNEGFSVGGPCDDGIIFFVLFLRYRVSVYVDDFVGF